MTTFWWVVVGFGVVVFIVLFFALLSTAAADPKGYHQESHYPSGLIWFCDECDGNHRRLLAIRHLSWCLTGIEEAIRRQDNINYRDAYREL